MECPFCTAVLPEEDLFCEDCGKPLHSAPQATQLPDCVCGAPVEEIGEDGYCGRCGRLAHRPASDHIEIVLSQDFAGVCDRGIRHQRNEDRLDLRQVGNSYVLVVCDGVSSSTQSELASSSIAASVANSLEASLRRRSASSPERTVRRSILDAQAALVADAQGMASADPPSTTVVAALVTGNNVALGWTGDSRAYWLGDAEELLQLTADHSWLNDVVAAGEMSLEEASQSPKAHGITRWLGADAGDNAEPDVTHFTVPGPGYLLLCSDGLWNYASSPQQLAELLQEGSALDTARRLVDYANTQGGLDNITAVLLRIREDNQSVPALADLHHS